MEKRVKMAAVGSYLMTGNLLIVEQRTGRVRS